MRPLYNAAMGAVSISCGVCPSEIAVGMATCPGCGRAVNDQDLAVMQVRLEGANFSDHDRGRRVRQGSKWVGVLAILFLVSGPIMFGMQMVAADKALEHLQQFGDDEQLEPIGGKTYTAGELRKEVRREPYQILIVNLVLAAIMGGLWVWARRAPLPAIACALALFVVVQLVSAVVDPSSIVKGILIKLIALAALGKGLKAALDARAAMQRPTA